jgi:hypothetical protein
MSKKIQFGKVYLNKTLLVLVPGFKVLGEEFNNKLKQLYIVGAFTEHESLNNTTFSFKSFDPVFIVIDTLFRPRETQKMLSWFTYQSYFLGGYYLTDTDYFNRFYVLVLSYPSKTAYKNFVEHKFSKMYSRKEVEKYFNVPLLEDTKNHLNKDKKAIQKHIENVYETFNTKISVKDVLEENYELLIGNKEQETLN